MIFQERLRKPIEFVALGLVDMVDLAVLPPQLVCKFQDLIVI